MIKSSLSYPGGKSRAAEKNANLIPPFEEFREPFVGGGSVFSRLRQIFPDQKKWINDKYSELATFWIELKSNLETLLNQIIYWKKEFFDGKMLFNFLRENKNNFSDLEKAAMFFVFNRITFSGTTEAGGFSKKAFEKRFTDSSIERLAKMPDVLENIKITNFDYENLVNADGENVFLFLDPPCFSATNSALYGKTETCTKVLTTKDSPMF